MPHIKSAKKRIKTSGESRSRNLVVKGHLRSAERHMRETLSSGDKAKSAEQFRVLCSRLDKAAKKGVIKGHAADRRKSRAAAKLKTLS